MFLDGGGDLLAGFELDDVLDPDENEVGLGAMIGV